LKGQWQNKLSNEIDDPIYQQAVEVFGKPAQKLMLIEECAELIEALCHYARGRVTDDKLIEEAVDVQLTLNQLRFMLNDESKWQRWFDYKKSRLADHIKER